MFNILPINKQHIQFRRKTPSVTGLRGETARPTAGAYSLTTISLKDIIAMIISFKDKEAEKLFNGKFSARLPQDIQRTASMKLTMLNAATMLETLRVPPSNNLEPLRGDRQGQHSIRINRQWRICFRWDDGNAVDVEIVDYH